VYVAIGVTVDGERDILRFAAPYRSRIGVSWPVRPAGTPRPPAAAPPAASGPSRATLGSLATSRPPPSRNTFTQDDGRDSRVLDRAAQTAHRARHGRATPPGQAAQRTSMRITRSATDSVARSWFSSATRSSKICLAPVHDGLVSRLQGINRSAGLASGGPAANTSNIRPTYACEQILPQVRGIARQRSSHGAPTRS
jgi:hypothetical protein